MKHFGSPEDGTNTNPARAQQLWQILVGKAHNRQTITYKQLSVVMFAHPAPGVLAQPLGHVMRFCKQNGLPPLTSVVVNSGTGTPGRGLSAAADPEAEHEQVYAEDWYSICPPTPDELLVAYRKGD